MTYNPNVPLGNQTISSTQSPIQTNFDQANIGFAIDHSAFTDNTATQGVHKKVSFLEQAADPAAAALQSKMYTKQVVYANAPARNRDEIFLRRSTNDGSEIIQMTNLYSVPATGSTGTTCLPGGIVLKWGTNAAITGTVTTIFAEPFPNNCYNILVTPIRATTTQRIIYVIPGSLTRTQFQIITDSVGGLGMYWQAIGN